MTTAFSVKHRYFIASSNWKLCPTSLTLLSGAYLIYVFQSKVTLPVSGSYLINVLQSKVIVPVVGKLMTMLLSSYGSAPINSPCYPFFNLSLMLYNNIMLHPAFTVKSFGIIFSRLFVCPKPIMWN